MSAPNTNPGGSPQPLQAAPPEPSPARPSTPRTGRWIALAMAVLWIAVIIGLYVVIVRLKLGGAEALRNPPAPKQTTP